MSIDQIIAYLGFLGAIIMGIVQNMYTSIPKYIGWPIIIILLSVSSYFILPPLIGIKWTIIFISILIIIMIALFVYYWNNRKVPDSKVRIYHPFINRRMSNKDKAHAIHQKIIELEAKFWKTKESLPQDEDLLKNAEMNRIMTDLLSELNKLGHLVKSSEFDKWSESFIKVYSRYLEFHMDIRDEDGLFSRARINTNLRYFVNKVKG